MKKTAAVLLLASLIALPLFFFKLTYAKERTLDYLPRDQELYMATKDYVASPYTLDESTCSDLLDLNTKVSRCFQCMSLKTLCPDCCITTSPARQVKCKALAADVPAYPPFEAQSSNDARRACQAVGKCDVPGPGSTDNEYKDFKAFCNGSNLPGCQNLGCPNGAPKVDASIKCEAVSGGWVCNDANISDLKYSGCYPVDGSTDCYKAYSGKYYKPVTALDVDACKAVNPSFSSGCWKYVLDDDFKTCLTNCQSNAQSYETKLKAADCCNRDTDVCESSSGAITGSNGARPGFQNNCNSNACTTRVNWYECRASATTEEKKFCCDNLTYADCLDFSNQKDQLIQEMAEGTRFSCFNDISKPGDEFTYEFVAKSNEKLMVIWQIQTSPHFCSVDAASPNTCLAGTTDTGDAPNTYFYTMVKIFDTTDGNSEIYPGTNADTIMNQKNFTAAFSIFAAIATGNEKTNPTKSIFKQGHKYKVKLYYMIAPLSDYKLWAKVSQLQLIILRVRE